MPSSSPSSRGDWRIYWALAACISAAVAITTIGGAFSVDAIRRAVRLTAQMSLVLFCAAFAAGALARLWPGPLTWALRQHRRQLGLAFATSHGWHAAALVAFAQASPTQFGEATDPAMYVFGGLAYLFILAMAATSFDRTAAWLGPRRWRLLHVVGGYDIWLTFLVAEGRRAVHSAAYWPYVALLIAVFSLRMVAMLGRPSPGGRLPAPRPAI